MSTDGTHLRYNAAFVREASAQDMDFIVAEEVSHCAKGHPWRMRNRNPQRWNRACDEVVRRELVAAGLVCPSSANWTPDPRVTDQMSAEQVYSVQGSDEPDENGQDPQDNADPEQPGDFTAPPSPKPGDDSDGPGPSASPPPLTESDWNVMAEEAAMRGRKAGTTPGDVTRSLRADRQSREDWRALLREFTSTHTPGRRSWARPDRRYLHSSLVLPGRIREGTARIDVYVDVSGSITQEMMDAVAPELLAILTETHPEVMRVIYHDDGIRRVDEYTPEDTELNLTAQAGGGTSFQPVIDFAADEPPACAVWFTDLECYDTPTRPAYPVLWLTPEHTYSTPPFPGQVVALTLHD